MADDPVIYSDTEKRIQAALANIPHSHLLGPMAREMEGVVKNWDLRGIDRHVQAAALTSHLASILAAMKIAAIIPPDFVDLLADDLVDTVKGRAVPGVREWLTPQ